MLSFPSIISLVSGQRKPLQQGCLQGAAIKCDIQDAFSLRGNSWTKSHSSSALSASNEVSEISKGWLFLTLRQVLSLNRWHSLHSLGGYRSIALHGVLGGALLMTPFRCASCFCRKPWASGARALANSRRGGW